MPLSKYGFNLKKHQKKVVDKNPEKYLLAHGCGCLSGDSVIKYNRAKITRTTTIAGLYRKIKNPHHNFNNSIKTMIQSNVDGVIKLNQLVDIYYSGEKAVYLVVLENGYTIKTTKEHRFLTEKGWSKLSNLKRGDLVATNDDSSYIKQPKTRYHTIGNIYFHPYSSKSFDEARKRRVCTMEKHRLVFEAKLNNLSYEKFILILKNDEAKSKKLKFVDPKKFHIHHVDKNSSNNNIENLEMLTIKEHIKGHKLYRNFPNTKVTYKKIISIKKIGVEKTYDIACESPYNNFVSNGIIVHNSGKTITLSALIKQNNIKHGKACIVTIKSDIEKWKNIVEKFELNADCYTKEQFKKAVTGTKIVKAYDPVKQKKVEVKRTVVKPLNLRKYDIIAYDEAHNATGITSMMYKSLMAYIKAHNPKLIWLGTGTPYSSTPWSLYALGNLLKMDWHYNKFRVHFFQYVRQFGPRGSWIPKKIVEGRPLKDEIARYINFLGKAVKIEDCVDIPPRVYQTEYFDLTADQKRAIREVNEDLVLTRNLRLHQICGGTLKTEDELIHFKSNKLNRLIEICKHEKKVFIVCKYKAEIEMIKSELAKKVKKPVFTFTGDNSSSRYEESIQAENAEECIVIANAACSAAYEIPSIPIMVFYSIDFSLINHEQIIDRIRRLSNPASRVYIYLICKNSIDEDVYASISNKKSFQAEIFKK